MAHFLAEFMSDGEAERLETAVIDAALEWTALQRHGEPEVKVIEAGRALFDACRELHKAREKAFAKSIGAVWCGE